MENNIKFNEEYERMYVIDNDHMFGMVCEHDWEPYFTRFNYHECESTICGKCSKCHLLKIVNE